MSSWWEQSVRGMTGAVKEYWDNIRNTDFFKSHPGLNEEEDLHRTIPIGMHGDGGSFSNHDSLFVLTWNSLVGQGTTRMTRFLMTVIVKSQMIPETMPAVIKILCWSFNAMLTGIEPLVNHLGEDVRGAKKFLAGRWKAALSQLRGDWEFYAMPSLLAFPKWNEVGRMCWKCMAVRNFANVLKYSRFDRAAPWRATRITHEKYLEMLAAENRDIPVLFDAVGFRVELVMVDVLHCVDLGIAAHIAGNVFWICITLHVFGPNIAASITELNAKMKQWEKDKRVPNKFRGKLTKDRIKPDGQWPKLKTQAAPMHYLARFALELAKDHLGEDCILVCDLLVQFYELLQDPEMFFSDAQKLRFQTIGFELCCAYAKLAAAAVADKKNFGRAPRSSISFCICVNGMYS